MKAAAVCFCAFLPLWAQTTRAVESGYAYDINGRRVPTGWSVTRQTGPGESKTVEHALSPNGRLVPREAVVERIIRDDASGRVVERTIIAYDPNGAPGPPVKVRIEETPEAAGGKRVVETTWRGDINGAFRLSERAVTEVRRAGDTEFATTTVARPKWDGSLETFERTEAETQKTKDGSKARISTYRPDPNGRFHETERQVVETKEAGSETVTNLHQYRVRGSQLVLDGQTLSRTVKHDGSEVTEVDILRADVPGRPTVPGKPALVERQTIQRTQSPGGLRETVLSRLASPNDAGKLETPRVIAERTCTGQCAP